jgi:hypothetical protein
VSHPASFRHAENWTGGYYELALELGLRRSPGADDRLLGALAAIWEDPRLDGCYRLPRVEPDVQPRLEPVPVDMHEPGHFYGRALLPGGDRVVCGTFVSRQRGDDGVDWLGFYLPTGALSGADDRVGAFPFPNRPTRGSSRAWREPLDEWLVAMATRVHGAVGFRVGLVGFEASAPGTPWDGHVPEERWIDYLVPVADTIMCFPTTHWDADWPDDDLSS